MAFRSTPRTHFSTESPESLFADIKSKRIPGLLTQQGDVMREYVQHHVNTADVAAQLPTGSGKTLVALLIAEWRRLTRHERAVYLCPTNQLVHQVVEQARSKYGLDVISFTGPKSSYSSADKNRYNSSQAVAITSYSALFNSNPFFEDPQLILLDDAHAAEQYVASNWTLDLRYEEESDRVLFDAVASCLRPHIGDLAYRRLTTSDTDVVDGNWVDKLPLQKLFELHEELEGVIAENVVRRSDPWYAWEALSGHVRSCNVYFTAKRITIRPYIAPTFSHSPFHGATQRIYLSATPGEGGELERVFGRRKISRLTPPTGSQKHSIGRRFFLFPELSLSKTEQDELLMTLPSNGRLLVLTGDNATANRWKRDYQRKSGATIFSAEDIETSKQKFVETLPAVAVLANRYDGIDFPDDECRQTLLIDIPTATNPQERFFITRMSSGRVYDARMLTRMIQSFGRCTRSATDYSLVVVLGDRLTSYLTKKDRQVYFHPELQAEIQFGLDECRSTTPENIKENIKHFLSQDGDWKSAEDVIYSHRDNATQSKLLGSDELATAVEHEVRFVEALWNEDLVSALESCRAVLSHITGSSLRGSRATWNYFAGSIASELGRTGKKGMMALASDYYRATTAAVPTLSWLYQMNLVTPDADPESPTLAETLQIDNLQQNLLNLGLMHNRDFDQAEAQIRAGLRSSETFEMAHKNLGIYLGFAAGKVESSGSPDPWWRLPGIGVWVFEDHAGAAHTSCLSVSKARQAASHENWIRSHLELTTDTKVTTILITPVVSADSGAIVHLGGVLLWNLKDFHSWVETAISTVRELRSTLTEDGDLEWRAQALGLLRQRAISPDEMTKRLPKAAEALSTL